MLFLEIILFLVAALAAGYAIARWVLVRPATAGVPTLEVRELRTERDRLRRELDEARRQPSAEGATDARVEHLKSAVHAAKRRIAELEEELGEAQRMIAVLSVNPSGERPAGRAPERLEQPDGAADDLKRLSGIGPGIERKLNELGIFHLWQIAALDPSNLAWLERHLRVPGGIERHDWVAQANALLNEPREQRAPAELEAAL